MLSEAEFDSLSKEKNMMARVIFKLYIYILLIENGTWYKNNCCSIKVLN